MPTSVINGVGIYWERHGQSGPPLVLVHGSWSDHNDWNRVVPPLATSYRVFGYDRRGHSQSERVPFGSVIQEDADDLASLIRTLALEPAHVIGASFGGVIALRLATQQPALFASLSIHEPPLIGVLEDHPAFPAFTYTVGQVAVDLRAGKLEEAARRFVENVALGPGAWDALKADTRELFLANALTFVDEVEEPDSLRPVGFERLAAFGHPVLVTNGTESPAFYRPIVEQVVAALPHAERYTFRGAGHVPQASQPQEFVRVIGGFVRRAAGDSAVEQG
ncbi:MAG: alpha/beta hydrolase [Acidobacteria bacterium]|nr:MAG: alpha/beta hydrolase [Acidobacteriota bacterium]